MTKTGYHLNINIHNLLKVYFKRLENVIVDDGEDGVENRSKKEKETPIESLSLLDIDLKIIKQLVKNFEETFVYINKDLLQSSSLSNTHNSTNNHSNSGNSNNSRNASANSIFSNSKRSAPYQVPKQAINNSIGTNLKQQQQKAAPQQNNLQMRQYFQRNVTNVAQNSNANTVSNSKENNSSDKNRLFQFKSTPNLLSSTLTNNHNQTIDLNEESSNANKSINLSGYSRSLVNHQSKKDTNEGID
jgi:hypothetical protein